MAADRVGGTTFDDMSVRANRPASTRVTDREVEVLRLVALGLTKVRIGRKLDISPNTA